MKAASLIARAGRPYVVEEVAVIRVFVEPRRVEPTLNSPEPLNGLPQVVHSLFEDRLFVAHTLVIKRPARPEYERGHGGR